MPHPPVLRTIILGVGLVLVSVPLSARAATLADYLQDGWQLNGFSNSTVAQLVLQKKERVLLCTISTHTTLDCADLSKWPVNETK
jgi:hypothetical protein